MNFSLDDRHRSLRRFLMNTLGSPPWRIRTERQPVADEERPIGVIEIASGDLTTRARTSIPQGDVEKTQTFSIALYTVIEETAAESRLAASVAADLLKSAITVGLVRDDEGHEGEMLTAPEMIPVYDYADVAVKGAERAGPAEHYGWMRVEDAPVRPVQDPDDPLRWTVVCDLRLSWEQGGRLRPPAPVAGEMAGEFVVGDGEV